MPGHASGGTRQVAGVRSSACLPAPACLPACPAQLVRLLVPAPGVQPAPNGVTARGLPRWPPMPTRARKRAAMPCYVHVIRAGEARVSCPLPLSHPTPCFQPPLRLPRSLGFAPWNDRLLVYAEESNQIHMREVPAAKAGCSAVCEQNARDGEELTQGLCGRAGSNAPWRHNAPPQHPHPTPTLHARA